MVRRVTAVATVAAGSLLVAWAALTWSQVLTCEGEGCWAGGFMIPWATAGAILGLALTGQGARLLVPARFAWVARLPAVASLVGLILVFGLLVFELMTAFGLTDLGVAVIGVSFLLALTLALVRKKVRHGRA